MFSRTVGFFLLSLREEEGKFMKSEGGIKEWIQVKKMSTFMDLCVEKGAR